VDTNFRKMFKKLITLIFALIVDKITDGVRSGDDEVNVNCHQTKKNRKISLSLKMRIRESK
jgi:predicted RNA-binding protein with RPS1 domain